MPADYKSFTGQMRRLHQALAALEPAAASIGIPPPQGEEWHALLTNKLLTQLELPPLLVVAIIGGTNIGKSVIFNHLAGENASAATPLAAVLIQICTLAHAEFANGEHRSALHHGFRVDNFIALVFEFHSTEVCQYFLFWSSS